jgi:hypothetical protein
VFDFDWDSFAVDSPAKEVTRGVVLSFSDRFKNGWIGRQLPGCSANAERGMYASRRRVFISISSFLGFCSVAISVVLRSRGTWNRQLCGCGWNGLVRADEAGNFLATILAFIVSGQV